MNLGERITFAQLLSKGNPVEIPIIQRDYAQGRDSVKEVREQFLATLYKQLDTTEDSLIEPLDLDFVYGSLEGDDVKRFSPLDGQQRLTTLFLLHWYLASLSGKSDDFRSLALDGQNSRFTYQTRTSSTEFFNALARVDIDLHQLLPGDAETVLSRTLRDSQWFFLSWDLDPTIRSALVMLDAIHQKFFATNGFYARLIQAEKPYITFQFLNLREFGLSDELYIKMNARGKPLTPFENFKARLEQHIDMLFIDETMPLNGRDLTIKEYVSHQIDTQWADLFWHYRDKQSNSFDEHLMNFIRSLVSIYYPPNKQGWLNILSQLRAGHIDFSFFKYAELGCFDKDFILALIKLLDVMSSQSKGLKTFLAESPYYDEEAVFKASQVKMNPRSGLDYTESVQFYAYCKFVEKFYDRIDNTKLAVWMRIMANLSINTPYNNLPEFQRSLISLNTLVDHSGDFIEFIADQKNYQAMDGFYVQQIREEHIKANLILKSEDWKNAIFEAEQHGYFKGQIEFLLSFCGVLDYFIKHNHVNWTADENTVFLSGFITYYKKSASVFGDDGLRSLPDFLWERALLATGDYLIEKGRNLSFLDDNDRDASWKRLLRGAEQSKDFLKINDKRAFVKSVLDQLDIQNIEKSLKNVIEHTAITDAWRAMIVECQEILRYCKNRFIRKISDDDILLLTKTQTNGAHLELFTYYLMLSYIMPKKSKTDLHPFTSVYPCEVYTQDNPPYITLSGCKIDNEALNISVFYLDGQYKLQIQFPYTQGRFPQLKQELTKQFGFVESNQGWLSSQTNRESICNLIDGVINLLREYADEKKIS